MVWQRDQNSTDPAPQNRLRPKPPGDWPVSGSFLGILFSFVLVGGIMLLQPQYAKGAVFPFIVAGWLISLCLHEFGHAYAAYKFGDDSVRARGYLTLDPLHYVDPMNSILMPMIMLAMGGIGLPGGAVFIGGGFMRQTKVQRALISAAGPAANILVLLALVFFMKAFAGPLAGSPILRSSLMFLALLQLTAIIFNLLPVPGFDGWGIIEPWMSQNLREMGMRIAPVSSLIVLVAFIMLPGVNRAFFDVVYTFMQPLGLQPGLAFQGLRLFQFWK
jgi:Zn-dependent protease